MEKHIITYHESTNPSPSNNISAGYGLGQKWFNNISGVEYQHKSDGVWVGDDNYITTGQTGNYLLLSGGTLTGSLTGTEFIKSGGTSSQFLKADGSVDSSNYSIGPMESITNNIPLFGDTSGSTLIDSGINLDNFTKSSISVIYTGLTSLINNSQLIPGQTYLLADYRTTYIQPISGIKMGGIGDVNENVVEPLLLAASSVNTLNPICSSALFPQDQIYYNVVNDTSVVPGCTTGYIYRRIDTQKKNDIGFDYRNVKYRRWQIEVIINDSTGINGTYGIGSVVNKTGTAEIYLKISNTQGLFSDMSSWRLFEWDNLSYTSYSNYEWKLDWVHFIIPVNSNFMDYYIFSTEPTIYGIFSNDYSRNTINTDFYCNSILFGSGYENKIGSGFYCNTINFIFSSNNISNNFSYNSIGSSFRYNTIGDGFSFNTISNEFDYNNIIRSFFYNVIGAKFEYNMISGTFSFNIIGYRFRWCQVKSQFNTCKTYVNFEYNNINNHIFNVDFMALIELYNKEYSHEISRTATRVVIEWIDDFGDTNIISSDSDGIFYENIYDYGGGRDPIGIENL